VYVHHTNNVVLNVHGEKAYGGHHTVGSRGHVGLGHPRLPAGSRAWLLWRLHRGWRVITITAEVLVVALALATPIQAAAAIGGGEVRSRPFVWK